MSRFINSVALLAAAVASLTAGGRGQETSPPVPLDTVLADARRLYDQVDHAGTVALLDRAISQLQARQTERTVQPLLVSAYQLRSRALFGLGDRARSQADMTALLRLDPGHRLPGDVSPRVVALFDETRRAVVGEVSITVRPDDAEVDIDGTPVSVARSPLSLAAGSYTIGARRAGYRVGSQAVTVLAGTSQSFALTLERTSASLAVVTVPAGVEVLMDGVPRGVTAEGGRNAPEVQELAGRLRLPIDQVSQKMRLSDLALGTHQLEFRKACFVTATHSVNVDRLDDLAIAPIQLKPATGTLRVSSSSGDGAIYVDDVPRGNAPAVVTECEGAHIVEVRAAQGRFVRRLVIRPGEQQVVDAQVKPAFAILSTSGLPDGLRGAEDLRVAVERAMGGSARVTLFAPTPERAQKALQTEGLSAGWLAFDRVGRPIGAAAENIAASERRELSTRISRAFDAQGVAAVTVTGADRSSVLVSLLAAGSAEPDVMAVRLDSPESLSRAVAALDAPISLYSSSLGILTVDVIDLPGPVVARVDRSATASGLVPGEVIVAANGRAVTTAQALEEVVDGLSAGTALTVETRASGATALRKVQLRPVLVPRAIAMSDQTLLFNPLLLHLRRLLASPTAADEPVLRLNLGIALMRLGNFGEAKLELERVRLPGGAGVADGTVNYLLGLCHEALGHFAEAERAWIAAKGSDALLTADGPPIKGLAEAKLAALTRTRGGA